MLTLSGAIAFSPSPSLVGAAPATTTKAAASTATASDPVAAAASSKRPLVDPSLHLDLALNLVVLQFIDDKGNVTRSIPSEKQLKAYQAHEASPAGQQGGS